MAPQKSNLAKPVTIELQFPANLTPRQYRAHAHRITELLLSQIDGQTWDNLSALYAGFAPDMPFQFSVDFRHAPGVTELASGKQLIDAEGRPYVRDEVIRLLRQTMLLPQLDDILVDGQSIKPAARTSFFSRWIW
jgi:hypothetical protein